MEQVDENLYSKCADGVNKTLLSHVKPNVVKGEVGQYIMYVATKVTL